MSRGNDWTDGGSNVDLDGPLPWHLVVDDQVRIRNIGRSFARVCPSMQVGELLSHHLSLERPDRPLDTFKEIESIDGKLVIARCLDMDLTLRGTFFISPRGDIALLAATPLVTDPGDLWNTGIQLTDFAPHEPIADLLFAIQARDTSLLEVREILHRERLISKNHRAILDSALDAMITIDIEGKVVSFNNSAEKMFGFARHEVLGRRISELIIPPDLREAHEAGIEKFRAEGAGSLLNQRTEITAQRADESTFPIELAIIPFENDGEQFFTATIRDLTDAKRQQAELDEAVNQERLLHRELDHRVKNMLSLIVALCSQAAEHASVDLELLNDLTNRVLGFSNIHELLSKEGATRVALWKLVSTCIDPFLPEDRDRVQITGSPLFVNPTAAVKLAMVFNELATNASKHGALKHEKGRIEINWNQADDQLDLTWKEHHEGEVPDKLEGGFGTMVLRTSIPYEFEGLASLEPGEDGIIFRASISLEKLLVT